MYRRHLLIPWPSWLHPQNLCSLLHRFLLAWSVANSSLCLVSVGMEHHRLGLFSMDRILPEPGSFQRPFPGAAPQTLPSQQTLAPSDQSSSVWTRGVCSLPERVHICVGGSWSGGSHSGVRRGYFRPVPSLPHAVSRSTSDSSDQAILPVVHCPEVEGVGRCTFPGLPPFVTRKSSGLLREVIFRGECPGHRFGSQRRKIKETPAVGISCRSLGVKIPPPLFSLH